MVLIEKAEEEENSIKEFIEAIKKEISISGSNQGKKSGPKVGYIKEDMAGKFISKWIVEADKVWPKDQRKDVESEIQEIISEKRPQDSEFIEMSAKVLSHYFNSVKRCIYEVVNDKAKIDHNKLSDKLTSNFEKDKERYCEDTGASKEFLSLAVDPSLQSGGEYIMKQLCPSSQGELKFDNVVVNIVMNYLDFNTQAARTFIFSPSKAEEEDYKIM